MAVYGMTLVHGNMANHWLWWPSWLEHASNSSRRPLEARDYDMDQRKALLTLTA